MWSTTDENSDIYKVNRSGGIRIEVSEETAEILQFTLDMVEQTNGSLDPSISPVVTARGFISREYHIPTEDEWRKSKTFLGRTVRMSVSNRTDSIEQKDLDRIFDRFYTTDTSRTHKTTGLGLAIVKQFTEHMGGEVDAALEKDIFTIEIVFEMLRNC